MSGISLLAFIGAINAVRGSGNHGPDIFAWIKENGGSVSSKLDIRKSTYSGRGLYTNKQIKPSSLVISLPFNSSLSVDTALQENRGLSKLQSYIESNQAARSSVSGEVILSTFVMMQMKDPQGRFADYFRYLRMDLKSTVMELPRFWSTADLAELGGTFALDAINAHTKFAAREFAVILTALPNLKKKHSLGEYLVATALVASRSYGSDMALLPGLDLVNHFLSKPDASLSVKDINEFVRKTSGTMLVADPETRMYELRTNLLHQKDEQVFNAYGLVSNVHFFTMYGFVVPWIHNLTCLAETSLKMPGHDLLTMPFARAWMRTDLTIKANISISLRITSCFSNDIEDVLGFARLWSSHADWADVEADCGLTRSGTSTGTELSKWRLDISCPHVRREEELAALGFLQRLVMARRSMIVGGTVGDEESLIADVSEPQTVRAAATIRRDEKFVLHQAEQFVSRAREQLQQAGSNWRFYMSNLLEARVCK